MSTAARTESAVAPRSWWWGFVLFAAASVVHILALALDAEGLAETSKLTLMPALAIAVLWAGRRSAWGSAHTLLLLALALSWLGDGAATFFPGLPTLPAMLLCFGLAHGVYIRLFWKHLSVRGLPPWSAVYAIWWVVLVLMLWPHLGGLAIAVALYGVLLGGTAATAARCGPLVAIGAAFFLASDTILAFRLFLPDAMPDWTSPAVVLSYCLGQGLIAAGAVRHLWTVRSPTTEETR